MKYLNLKTKIKLCSILDQLFFCFNISFSSIKMYYKGQAYMTHDQLFNSPLFLQTHKYKSNVI